MTSQLMMIFIQLYVTPVRIYLSYILQIENSGLVMCHELARHAQVQQEATEMSQRFA